jgi:vancomycin permeability regulator SanA
MTGRIWRTGTGERRASIAVVLACATAMACLWPLLQIATLGRSDYRRPAEVAVVLGARVYADGRLSDAVADRVRAAVELYREGLVAGLIMSGGPGDGAIHETEAMRDAAIQAGVPAEAIRLDRDGLNTRATAANTVRMAGGGGVRFLVVSEFYHLPRIRLAYAVEGLEVCTVPARPRHLSRWFPLGSLMREVPAYWLYYFRSVLPGDRRAVATTRPVVGPGSHTQSHAQAHAHPSRNQRHPGPRGSSLAHPDC